MDAEVEIRAHLSGLRAEDPEPFENDRNRVLSWRKTRSTDRVSPFLPDPVHHRRAVDIAGWEHGDA